MKMEKITSQQAATNTVREPIPSTSAPVDYSFDPYAGFNYGTKPILPLYGENSVSSHLDTGRVVHSSNEVITYSFNALPHATGLFNNPNYGLNGANDYSPFTAAQQAAGRAAIQLWDDLIPQTFKETNGRGADIVLANSSDPGQAFAYYPVPGKGFTYQSDVFIADPKLNPSNLEFHYGQYGNTTLIHELGHTLGLSHPGAYNYDPNVPQTFAGLAEYAQDTYQYSIMSYWNGTNSRELAINWDLGGVVPGSIKTSASGAVTSFSFRANYPEAPMLHDIMVIQDKYGADLTTRVTDTTYGFDSNAGNALYDFNANAAPMYSIYDAGGSDTINASGFDVSQYINLNAGAFSSIGGGAPSADAVNAYWTEYYAGYGLAFPAGYFTDAFLDQAQSAVQSIVEARIFAETGVHGIGATQYDNVSIAYNTVIENAIGGSARDLMIGNDVANQLEGRGGDDVIRGGGGNDSLLGGDGNDTLTGDAGNDTLTGGAGADTFKFAGLEIGDVITDFNHGQGDVIDLSGLGTGTQTFIGGSAFSGHAGEVNYVGNVLSADTDGNGVADFSVALTGMPEVHADALVLHA